MTDSKPPRILPLPEHEWSEEQRGLLARGTEDGEPRRNGWFQTLVKHPKLYKHWSAYGSALLYRGLLTDRDREVVVLRNAAILGAHMQWTEHAKIAREIGIDEPTIETLKAGRTAGLDARDAVLARATEELLAQGEIADATWEELARHLDDERQLIELIMLVGSYATMAWLQNTLRVAYEGGGDESKASDQYHRDRREIGHG